MQVVDSGTQQVHLANDITAAMQGDFLKAKEPKELKHNLLSVFGLASSDELELSLIHNFNFAEGFTCIKFKCT